MQAKYPLSWPGMFVDGMDIPQKPVMSYVINAGDCLYILLMLPCVLRMSTSYFYHICGAGYTLARTWHSCDRDVLLTCFSHDLIEGARGGKWASSGGTTGEEVSG